MKITVQRGNHIREDAKQIWAKTFAFGAVVLYGVYSNNVDSHKGYGDQKTLINE